MPGPDQHSLEDYIFWETSALNFEGNLDKENLVLFTRPSFFLTVWKIYLLAHGPRRFAERVLASPGRSRDGNLLLLPDPVWFSKGIDEVQECFGFSAGALSGPYTVVARGVSSSELEAISPGEKLVLVNPDPKTMKQVNRLPHAIVVASQDSGILALARESSCETWALRRTDNPEAVGRAVNDGDVINYSLSKCYDQSVTGRYPYEIDHFLGPVPLVSMALRDAGELSRVIGWDQYLPSSFSLGRPFGAFRALVSNANSFDRSSFAHLTGEQHESQSESDHGSKLVRRFVGKLRRKLGQVLALEPKSLQGVDMRHAIRNLLNIWICRLLLESGVRVDGSIVPLAKSGVFWPCTTR